jgi:outer membrane protein assembly factor BamB
VRFYQTTDAGLVIAGTKKSLYAIDGETGDVLWRRRDLKLDQTDGRSRIEAADVMTGKALWQSDRIKGSIMHLAVDPQSELVALVLVRDAKGQSPGGLKRKPAVHVLDLSSGDEMWKRELSGDLEMIPARWSEDGDEETLYTLDNYRPPLILDGRLYLFYEGVTSLEARTGRERIRERFRVNEEGLALTEADPVWDEQNLYVSSRGRLRAVSRATARTVWEGKDLGLTPELVLARGLLFVRTGGRFTRLRDGNLVTRGPYGVSAIDPRDGKVIWRYRGADKGITNLALPDASRLTIADRDDLIVIDGTNGKPDSRIPHRIDRAAFVLINEQGHAVVGGRSQLAAFDINRGGEALWRVKHEPPGRGILRTVAAIAARTAALYFRYGGVATTAFRGARVATGATPIRWSGLAARTMTPNLTDLATGAAREYVGTPLRFYGVSARVDRARRYAEMPRRPDLSADIDVDIEESLLDRLDPARQLDRLSRFLWRRQRLAVLRGSFMYFYTGLESGRGLAGVNLNTGQTERAIKLNEPDYRLATDEITGTLFVAKDNRLMAYHLNSR